MLSAVCAEEDRCYAEGARGQDEGWQEDGLSSFIIIGTPTLLHLARVVRFSALVAHKNRHVGRSATPNILPFLMLMVMAYAILANGSNLFSQSNRGYSVLTDFSRTYGRLVRDQARERYHVHLQVNNHAHQRCQSNAMPEDVA
jgi:hypothetical protein